MYTLQYNYDNVLILKLLHVSGLTGLSSRIVQFYNTTVQPFYHPQYAEMSQVRECLHKDG